MKHKAQAHRLAIQKQKRWKSQYEYVAVKLWHEELYIKIFLIGKKCQYITDLDNKTMNYLAVSLGWKEDEDGT